MIFKFTKKQAREIAYSTKKHPKTFTKSDPLEKDIESKIVAYSKSLGCLVYKFTSPSRRSVPDRLFITKKGEVFFIEFKRLGAKPTPSQDVEIDKIKRQGVPVFVVDSVDAGKTAVDAMCREKFSLSDF